MQGDQIRQKLHAGERVYGTHIASLMNPVAAAMASEMTLDFAFFCTEHMPLDRGELSMMCQFYAARGISPVVRVPSPDPALIRAAIDGGAEGIVVPYVETVEQVKQAVGAVKYGPIKGAQLHNILHDGQEPPEKTQQFLDDFNRHQYLIIGIESVAAIKHLESLITVKGVDGVFLGPHDITTSMNIPTEYDDPMFRQTIEDVVRRCRHYAVGVGLHTKLLDLGEPTVRSLLAAGMNWIINGADITVMRDAMNEQLARLRDLAGDNEAERSDGDTSAHKSSMQSCIG